MSKLSKAQRLTKKLIAIDGHWKGYSCDDRLFQSQELAIKYARQLSKVRGTPQCINSLKIPGALPVKPILSVMFPEGEEGNYDERIIYVYFVDGDKFKYEDEARDAAARRGRESGRRHNIMRAKVDMEDIEFVESVTPYPKHDDTEEEEVADTSKEVTLIEPA